MASTDPQRTYRAACPGCGAPVEFRSAQSAYAICSYCRSTVLRSGETLQRVGKMAELFEDHSPLQLLATGRWQGRAFTLVGRLQYRGESGAWTEWNALFDDGTAGVLGEDNGAYVFTLPASLQREVPQASQFRVGATTAIAGKPFNVTSNEQVALVSAQGELPKLPVLGQAFTMVELRSSDGEVVSVDYGGAAPQLARGSAVRLEDLQLAGLRDEQSAKEEGGRQFNCPQCGAPVDVTLAASKAVTCRACNSLIDLTRGAGAELAQAQEQAFEPAVPLGATGQLQGVRWQVVGFQHRSGHEPGDDEEFGWDEYLLYNRKRGFIFLVDSQEGWSLVKPTTGAPALTPGEQGASYLGTKYALKYSYEARTDYVAGEFYWPVERGQRTFNRDFASGDSLLSMERSPREVTWSTGSQIASDTVAKAFGLEQSKELLRRDAGPTSAGAKVGCGTIVLLFIVILVLLVVIKACADDTGSNLSSGGRTGGGSFGGYSGGGGHK